jgi:hypothetical protein
MTKEIKLHFKKCTKPEDSFYLGRTIKKLGSKSTFTFVDEIGCFKLTAEMICSNKKTFEDTKNSIAIVRFQKNKQGARI